jgi:toxin ParE1/3/4
VTSRVVYSPQARQQLSELYLWIATESGFPDRAERFVSAIVDHCDGLANLEWRGMIFDPGCG